MPKVYVGTHPVGYDGREPTTADRTEVRVAEIRDGRQFVYPLPHFTRDRTGEPQSPDTFRWGYGGAGPSALARSILFDYLRDADRAIRLAHAFKADKIATQPASRPLTITASEIEDWLAGRAVATDVLP